MLQTAFGPSCKKIKKNLGSLPSKLRWIILEMIDGRTWMNKTEDKKVNDDVSFSPKDGIDYMLRKDGKNLL